MLKRALMKKACSTCSSSQTTRLTLPVTEGESKGETTESTTAQGGAFEGTNKEGEPKSDPEKALKDSRGGAGLNALDQVKADEKDSGKTSKVGATA